MNPLNLRAALVALIEKAESAIKLQVGLIRLVAATAFSPIARRLNPDKVSHNYGAYRVSLLISLKHMLNVDHATYEELVTSRPEKTFLENNGITVTDGQRGDGLDGLKATPGVLKDIAHDKRPATLVLCFECRPNRYLINA